MTWTCRTCDPPAVFKSWAAAERHDRPFRWLRQRRSSLPPALHVQDRPFPGIEPAPAPDPKKTAAGALAHARLALVDGQLPPAPPCPPGCTCSPWCRDEWTYAEHGAPALGPCRCCGEPCRSIDPAGVMRHPSCGVPA